jgi:hypothetical protein
MPYSTWKLRAASFVAFTSLLVTPFLPTPTVASAQAFDVSTTSPTTRDILRAGSLLGFNDHPLDSRAQTNANVMIDQVVALGGSFVRIDAHWPWFESTRPGRANWNADQVRLLDRYLDAAHSRGIEVELTVLGTPCWAAAGPARACTAPERESIQTADPRNPQEFADFVGALVTFAAGRVQYIGVGNEPNHPAFSASPDPAVYTRLLQLTSARIKAVDPGVAVVAGALAPGNPDGARMSTLEYLQGMYTAGARGAFDYLEFHPYTDGRSIDWFDPRWPLLSFEHSVPAVRAVMIANGDDRPMILGESGWTTLDSASCSDCGSANLGVSPTAQSDNLVQALDFSSQLAYVHKFVVYELADHGPSESKSQLDHFGVLQRDLSAKPAASALAQQIAGYRQLATSAAVANQAVAPSLPTADRPL